MVFSFSMYSILYQPNDSFCILLYPSSCFVIRYLIYSAIFFALVIHNSFNILILTLLRKTMANLINDFHSFESQNLSDSSIERFDRIRKKRNRDFITIISTNLAMYLGAIFILFIEFFLLVTIRLLTSSQHTPLKQLKLQWLYSTFNAVPNLCGSCSFFNILSRWGCYISHPR